MIATDAETDNSEEILQVPIGRYNGAAFAIAALIAFCSAVVSSVEPSATTPKSFASTTSLFRAVHVRVTAPVPVFVYPWKVGSAAPFPIKAYPDVPAAVAATALVP